MDSSTPDTSAAAVARRPFRHAWILCLVVGAAAVGVIAWKLGSRTTAANASAPGEADAAAAGPQAPDGWQIREFAGPDDVTNPVAMSCDGSGRLFVAETTSAGNNEITGEALGMTDLEGIGLRTVEQRRARLLKDGRKLRSADWAGERIRVYADTTGRGNADSVSVFANGFNQPDTGIAEGVLAHRGNVWFTCAPNFWMLREDGRSGRAASRRVLHTGYGLEIAGATHGLHGLTWGPDGRIYFSMGDRGLHVADGERTVSCPDSGAVLRCNPDGTGLEIYATGLRNPEELAFDEYGNLFTGDNDQDPGDESRLVHVVEGGDSGWRRNALTVTESPWIREKLWKCAWDGQAAYIIPPVAELPGCAGPCGLAYDPGTGLPERYRSHFFLCDFGYAAATSSVQSFALKPNTR